jgi:putative transposase
VLSWRISNSMDASFCVDCLEEALIDHGKPDMFNSDQGVQFTSLAFTGIRFACCWLPHMSNVERPVPG